MLRIALRETTTRDAIDDAAHEAGLLLVNILPERATHPAQIIYTSQDRRALIYLIEDARLGALYFVLQGDEAEEQALGRALRAKLPVFEQDEIHRLAESAAPREAIRGLGLLAITSGPSTDPTALALFRAALRHPDEGVRDAARAAANYVAWPELSEASLFAAAICG